MSAIRAATGAGIALGLAFASALAPAAPAYDANRARLNYMLNCQGCHLPDASGFPGKVPNMRGEVGKFLEVEGGREFIARVPGVATAALDDQRLAHLLNWMLREFSAAELPADFREYDAPEVGRLRRTPLTDVIGERARLLQAIGSSGRNARADTR